MARPLGAAVVALAIVLLAGPAASAATPVGTLQRLVGQRLIVAMDGPTPSPSLLARIAGGEVGGVVLFGRNLTTKSALVALTSQLHRAAADAGQPRLLIAVDQEGGTIKRIPWAPPTLSPPQMGALASTPIARAQGLATGQALKALGIDMDLAPIADVPASTSSFLYLQRRTWSFSASRTASLAVAFAQGLQAGGVIPVLKHFPGLGYATLDTDLHMVTIRASRTALAPGLLAVPDGGRGRTAGRDALERDLHRLGRPRGGRLVAGDQHDPAAGPARVPGRHDDGLARWDRRVARAHGQPPRRTRGDSRDGSHPAHRIGGHESAGVRRAPRRRRVRQAAR